MRLETLILRGVLRFEDAVSLDLRELPAGLIALVGGNGEGKTSLLEAWVASLYRELPSRRGRSLLDVTHGKAGFIASTFSVEGRGVYGASVSLNAVARTSEAVLSRETATTTNEGILREVLTDGKVTTFDHYVAEHFPPLAVILASSFAAQNREGSFVLQKAKARKELFAALLGLEDLEAMGETANRAARLIEGRVDAWRTERDILARDASPEIDAALTAAVCATVKALEAARAQAIGLDEYLSSLRAELETVAESARLHEQTAEAVTALEAQKARLQTTPARFEAERDRVEATRVETEQDLTDRLETRLTDLELRMDNNRALLSRGTVIRAAVETVARTTGAIAALDQTLAERRAEQASHSRARVSLNELLADRRQVERKLVRAMRDRETLDVVPCHEVEAFRRCQFLVDAGQAAAKVPALEADLASAERSVAEEAQRAILEASAVADAALDTAESQREALQETLQAAQGDAGLVGALEATTDRLTELEGDMATALADAKTQRDKLAALIRDQLAVIDEQSTQSRVRYAEVRAALDTQRETLAATADAGQRRRTLDEELERIRQRHQVAVGAVAQHEADQRTHTERSRQLEGRRAEMHALQRRSREAGAHGREWDLLATALSRDGLPTLEIAAAGPTVSTYTNDLLTACFGTRFSVELVTQAAKKKAGEGLKEVFTVQIFDNKRGGEPRDIADLSGGEQVIVDEALKNAIAIYANQRSHMPMRTCWRDETTGALDAENADRYLAMLRKVQTLGGFHQVLFVTHNPDAATQADAQIRFADGGLTCHLPPYAP